MRRLIITIVLAAFSIVGSGIGSAQTGEEGQRGKRLVTLTRMPKVTKGKTKGWTISVAAKAPLLPTGTKIRFLLTWRSQTIESFTVKTDASKKVSEEFKLAAAPISTHQMMFRTEVHSEDQSAGVKRVIAKDAETFHPGLEPWTDYHLEQQFPLASPEELEAELGFFRTFFQERYTKLAELDRKVNEEFKKAKDGTAYVSGDALDVGKWRKLMDQDVIPGVVKIQQEILESFEKPRFIPHRLVLVDLQEISRGVAVRVTRKSMDLYRSFEAVPSEADKKPEKLQTKTRSRGPVKGSYLQKLIEKINKALGIVPPPANGEGDKTKDGDKGSEEKDGKGKKGT